MRISDWSSDVCSSDLEKTSSSGANQAAVAATARMSTSSAAMKIARLSAARARSASSQGRKPAGVPDRVRGCLAERIRERSEEHTSELQSLMRISYAVFCLKKKKNTKREHIN